MDGHATAEELKEIASLEKGLNLDYTPIPDIIELAVLYLEPCHREEDAIELLEQISKRHPDNAVVKFWLCVCYVFYKADKDNLDKAEVILNLLINEKFFYQGASYLLLSIDLDFKETLTIDRKLNLLEESVRLEPDWVLNRQLLALAYKENSNYDKSLLHLNTALENINKAGFESMNNTTRNFEELITARLSHKIRERIEQDIAELKTAKN